MLVFTLFLCAAVTIIGAAPTEAQDLFRTNTCPPGWLLYARHCYMPVSTPKTWAQAERHCVLQGGNLASVHSPEEYVALQEYGFSTDRRWIGGFDAVEEGVWMWSDGTRFEYTNWADRQPTGFYGGQKQDCLAMNFGDELRWDDEICSSRMPFICARRL